MYQEIDLFAEYLLIERNCSDHTIKSYTSDLRDFNAFLIEMDGNPEKGYDVSIRIFEDAVIVSSIQKNDIISFIEYCYDRGMKRSSIERKISCLKRFFSFLFLRDIIKKNPASTVLYPKREKRLPGFLYTSEIDRILDFKLENFADYRDRALLCLFFSTGARVSEISGADIMDLDFENLRLKVRGKGNVDRIVFLTGECLRELTAYLKIRKEKYHNSDGPLFINQRMSRLSVRGMYNIVKNRTRNAGLHQKVSPHTFRHSFATELMNKGAGIRAVQEMLGHKSLSTTQKYTHTTRESLKRTYMKTHPHAQSHIEED